MHEVNEPSPSQSSVTDPSQTLVWIEGRLTDLYLSSVDRRERQQQLDRESYLQLYNAVTNYCRATRRQEGELILYHSLERAIRLHCQGCSLYITEKSSFSDNTSANAVLSAYLKQWTAFLNTSQIVRHLFAYPEKSIYRAIDMNIDFYLLRDLHKKVWREEVLGMNGDSKGSTTILQAVEWQQKQMDQFQSGDVIASFAQLGVALSNSQLVMLS